MEVHFVILLMWWVQSKSWNDKPSNFIAQNCTRGWCCHCNCKYRSNTSRWFCTSENQCSTRRGKAPSWLPFRKSLAPFYLIFLCLDFADTSKIAWHRFPCYPGHLISVLWKQAINTIQTASLILEMVLRCTGYPMFRIFFLYTKFLLNSSFTDPNWESSPNICCSIHKIQTRDLT